ncbi:MAG TPA: PDZ domain-containing protein [Gemmataceae bacterium]|nr:PDZ domain-containing protein [Gemmataceae bacterium]
MARTNKRKESSPSAGKAADSAKRPGKKQASEQKAQSQKAASSEKPAARKADAKSAKPASGKSAKAAQPATNKAAKPAAAAGAKPTKPRPSRPAETVAPQAGVSAAEATRELEEVRRQAQAARKQLTQESQEQARTLREALAESQRELTAELQRQMAEIRESLQSFPDEVAALKRQLREIGKQVPDAARRVEAIREAAREVEELRQELQSVKRNLSETREEVEEVRQEIEEAVPPPEAPVAVIVPPVEGRNRLGLTVAPGVVIAEVHPDSPGAKAGLAHGDVVISVNGEPVQSASQLRSLVHGAAPNEEITLQVRRRGSLEEIKVRLEGAAAKESATEDQNRLGVMVAPGVVVDEVAPGTPAAGAGLERGDVITALNGAPVVSGEDLRQTIHRCAPGEEVTVEVTRGGAARWIKVRLDELAPTVA